MYKIVCAIERLGFFFPGRWVRPKERTPAGLPLLPPDSVSLSLSLFLSLVARSLYLSLCLSFFFCIRIQCLALPGLAEWVSEACCAKNR